MRNFIEQSFEGIAMIDEKGRITEWNPQQERITNILRDEALGKYCWEICAKLVNIEKAEDLAKNMRKMILSLLDPKNKEQTPLDETEYIFIAPDKTEQHVIVTTFRIVLNGKIQLGQIVRDVTLQKLTQIELEKYRMELEKMIGGEA